MTDFSNRLSLKHVFIIVFACFAVYANTLHNPFIWDQEVSIAGNPVIRSFDNIKYVFTTDAWGKPLTQTSFYRPFEVLTFMFDYHFWELNPFGYHISTIFLHTFASILLMFFFSAVGLTPATAFCAALIFAVHPVNTETVDYSIRGNILATIFSLSTFLLILKPNIKNQILTGIICLVLYVFALLSKEWSVVLPFVVITYFAANRFYTKKPSVLPKFTIVMLTAASLVYSLLRIRLLSDASTLSLSNIAHATFFERMLTLPVIIYTYIRLIIAPLNLHMEYHFVAKTLSNIYVWLGISTIILICAAIYLISKSAIDSKIKALFVFFALWFFMGLFPFYNVLVKLHSTVTEGWLYFPAIGFIGAVFAVTQGFLKNSRKSVFVFAIVFGAFFVISYARNAQWQDPLTLYTHDLKLEPDSFLLANNAGVVNFRNGNLKEAKKYFEYAIAVSPNKAYDVAYNNLGVIFQNEGNSQKAVELYKRSIELNNYELAYGNLGKIYLFNRHFDEALELLEKGVKHYPLNAEINTYLAVTYFTQKNYAASENILRFVVSKLDPNNELAIAYLKELEKLSKTQS